MEDTKGNTYRNVCSLATVHSTLSPLRLAICWIAKHDVCDPKKRYAGCCFRRGRKANARRKTRVWMLNKAVNALKYMAALMGNDTQKRVCR